MKYVGIGLVERFFLPALREIYKRFVIDDHKRVFLYLPYCVLHSIIKEHFAIRFHGRMNLNDI